MSLHKQALICIEVLIYILSSFVFFLKILSVQSMEIISHASFRRPRHLIAAQPGKLLQHIKVCYDDSGKGKLKYSYLTFSLYFSIALCLFLPGIS
jgi:hypothetical protein